MARLVSYSRPFFGFQPHTQSWLAQKPSHLRTDFGTENIRTVTYNVWFSRYNQRERFTALSSLLQHTQADVVCLQEVTPPFLSWLVQEGWVREQYSLSDVTGETLLPSGYGVVILCRGWPITGNIVPFPTNMGRSLLSCMIKTGTKSLCVATVHLESLGTAPVRAQQLRIASMFFDSQTPQPANSVLVGDFNFCSYKNYGDETTPREQLENNVLEKDLPGWTDAWPALCADEMGYTYDSVVNTMLRRYEQFRFDRVMYRLGTGRPVAVNLLGTDSIAPHAFVSDHFGLQFDLHVE